MSILAQCEMRALRPARMLGMISATILTAIQARLAPALCGPHPRYRPLIVDDVDAGWLDDAHATRLAHFGAVFRVLPDAVRVSDRLRDIDVRTAAFAEIAHTLRAEGELPAWRDERYAVARTFGATPLFYLERGAARWFGVRTWAAHVNGVSGTAQFPRLWFARRSPHKAIDPGMLDNLVGGGIGAGTRVDATVVKEAWEEAGIEASIARLAYPVGAVHLRRALPDGLQRETVFVHDLALPETYIPANQDGEAVEYRLVDLAETARLIGVTSGSDEVTIDASVVVLDFLLRYGAIAADAPDYVALEALRHVGIER